MKSIFFLLSLFIVYSVALPLEFGYIDENVDTPGPSFWHEDFRYCGTGASDEKQSPIDISSATYVHSLGFLAPTYGDFETAVITNTGHTIRIEDLNPGANHTLYVDGLMQNYYVLDHIETHWSQDDDDDNFQNTEHTIEGRQYDFEMQFVHYNSIYDDYDDAIKSRNPTALAIVSIFYQRDGRKTHPELNRLANNLPNVMFRDEEIKLSNLDVDDFYPTITDFFAYTGSLTSPGCDEVVQWIVIRDPLRMSEEQLAAFRRVLSDDDGNLAMAPNTRPVQPLNGRNVIKNFDDEDDENYFTTFNSGDESTFYRVETESSDSIPVTPYFALVFCLLALLFFVSK